MILYHGTPQKNALSIIEAGEIRNRCNRIWDSEYSVIDGNALSLKTSDGYVYLTDKFSMAAFYGNAARIKSAEEHDSYYVFKVDIPEDELLQDADELRMNWKIDNPNMSAKESLEKCHCVTVGHSINKNNYKIEYIEIPIRNIDHELIYLVRQICEYKNDMEEDPKELMNELERYVSWKEI